MKLSDLDMLVEKRLGCKQYENKSDRASERRIAGNIREGAIIDFSVTVLPKDYWGEVKKLIAMTPGPA